MYNRMSDKKKSLLAYKEELLRDLKYFEKRIEEARLQKKDSFYFDDDDSDCEIDFTLDTLPHISQLKADQDMLKTCLHATQELTNLYVLQSEVNVMVNDPVLEWETPVTEEGTWREVTADCRIDMVPVTIQFYAHQPSHPFGPTSYRGLRVRVLKAAHEAELRRSILSKATSPSDAVEVLRNYSTAHRARRTILARLAEKYPDNLFMEPLADGGYVLKCANLLEMCWTLENKWSPVASFHHRMKFSLEYMDEAYVKIISHAYKELLQPALEADERLRLLSKIVATCLAAAGPTQELYESMESDVESENLRKRRTTLDEEIEEPTQKKQMDSEVMAPPKTVPKKTKPKGKENNVDNANQVKAAKRPVADNIAESAKKAKLSDQGNVQSNVSSKDSKKANVNVVNTKKSVSKENNDGTNAKKPKNVNKTNNAVNSESVDKEIPISNGGSSKNIIGTENSNIMKNTNGKPSKVQDKIVKDSEEKTATKTKPTKVNKNKKETIKTTDDGISSTGKNVVDTNTVKDVQPSKNKASNKENVDNKQNKTNLNVANKNVITKPKSTSNVNNNKENGSSKDDKNNPNDNVASKNSMPKSKSATNINENVAKTKGKSMDRPKSANPEGLNSGQINPKPVLNLQKKKIGVIGTDKTKAKTNKQNPTKVKENLNNNINGAVVKRNEENISKVNKTQNVEVPTDIDNNKNDVKNTEKPVNIKTNPKSTAHKDELAKYRASLKSVNSKQHDTLQKAVVKNSLLSKVSDKISEKIDNVTTKNTVIAKKTNIVKNIDKNTDKTNKPISNKIDNVNKVAETGNKPQNAPASVKNAKNSPTKVNKMNILNPRNRKSIGNLKMNKNKDSDIQKEGLQKINTKIPQKLGLKHFRGDIKNKPLRISPRKMQSISKDSQNSSGATVATGIPRLMKKPVPKLK